MILGVVRQDGRCGPDYPTVHFGPPTEYYTPYPGMCDHRSWAPCCNKGSGYCGNTTDHCDCSNCIDYRKKQSKVKI